MKRLYPLFAILLLAACSSPPILPPVPPDDDNDDGSAFTLVLTWPSGLGELTTDIIDTKTWSTAPADFDFGIRGKVFLVTPAGERRISFKAVHGEYTDDSRELRIPLAEAGELRIAMYARVSASKMVFAWESVQEIAPGDTVTVGARILTGGPELLSVDHRILRAVLAPGETRSYTVEALFPTRYEHALILPHDQYELVSVEVLSGPISISYPDAGNPYLLTVTMAADAPPEAKGILKMTVRGLGDGDTTEVEEQLFTDTWFWVSSK